MEFAQLGDKESDTTRSASIAFYDSIPDGAVYVRRELIDEQVFRSRHRHCFGRQLGDAVVKRVKFTLENKFLSDDDKPALDEHGVVKQGTIVQDGDVLWSCLAIDDSIGVQKKGKAKWVDDSERVPAPWDGATVVETEFETDKHLISIRVTLELLEELSTGDMLYAEDQALGVVAKILESHEALEFHDDAEVFASTTAAERLKCGDGTTTMEVAKGNDIPRFNVLSRIGGPYSLISRQPLNRGQYGLAQRVSLRHFKWLMERGFSELAGEFAGLKCDELESRSSLEAFAKGEIERDALPAPSCPMSLWVMQAELMSMGFHVKVDNDEPRTLQIRPATRDEMLTASSGCVRKPETLNYRTLRGEPDGLFCPTIFNDDAKRFGHVELAHRFVPLWWRVGSPSPLARMLPLTQKQIESLIYHQSFVRLDGGQPIVGDDEAVRKDPGEWLSGGEAIHALLQAFADLPPGLSHGADLLTPDVILVPPSPIRPLVLLDSGNYATSDLNDHYRRVINRNNRLRKLVELNAPLVIVRNESRMLQLSLDGLFANELTRKPVLGSNDQPLKSLYDICLRQVASVHAKSAVFSARARVVVDAGMPRHSMEAPEHILNRLRLTDDTPALLTMEDGDALVALTPQAGPDSVFRIPPAAAEALAYAEDGDEYVSLHAPLRPAAVIEARRLQRGEFEVRGKRASSWLESDGKRSLAETLDRLVEAALSHERVPLDTPKTMLIAGKA